MSTARKFHHRSYLRHPSEMPLLLLCESHPQGGLRRIHNVSLGGLACRSEASLLVGTRVIVQIPVVAPPFEARGEVVWCRRVDACYELGIQFSSEADAFAARMVEQLCYIERYRNEVLTREGRVIDSQTAASEWINKFAASFPHIS